MLSFLVGSLLRIERCKLQLHKSQSSWGYREPAGSLILALMALTSCDHELLPMHFSYQLATFQALALGTSFNCLYHWRKKNYPLAMYTGAGHGHGTYHGDA
ncbi:hypothetical protein P8452_74275 [Trifolium repens]|nr:hypothetical protein P8452_07849 [Trifolium repens]WJX92668.1 hypothetical protein P8452_74275 [Trifolium repens]